MFGRVTASTRTKPFSTPFWVEQRHLDELTSVISVQGELDLSTAPRLKWTLVDAIETGHTQLVVDLSLTTFMDSTALGVLVALNRTLGTDTRLAIRCDQESVLRIFQFAGMDGVLPIFATLEQALAGVQADATEQGGSA